MDMTSNTFQNLFEQLGLETNEEAIQRFIEEHSLAEGVALHKADFWTPAQAQFLKESYVDDSDWVVTIDQLNTALRKQ
jgi:hypothetical protein